MENKMKANLPKIDQEKLDKIFEIEDLYESGKMSLEEARKLFAEKVGKIRPYHIALIEQTMTEEDDHECIRVNMTKTLQLLDGFMDYSRPDLPDDHPITHYYRENDEMRKLLLSAEDLIQYPVIKNQWLELYDKISQYPLHYKRKQNQLYPVLEQKGFTRPTTVMWTFDDLVRDIIRESAALLAEDKEEEFIAKQRELIDYARDLMHKEEVILYPTSMALINEHEFEEMKEGDQEIGFAFFSVEHKPKPSATATQQPAGEGFAHDLQALLSKYGYGMAPESKLDVTTGKLTLEQVNLIYQHLPFDISFVDENELVCFYSDTDHRIFPRSKNVIGREVMNCHPKKSAHIVREVVDKLRSGEQDKAEFWINKPGVFLYITYVAVRDAQGRFRGVLEVMQDCTHIRELEGSQTLLTWANHGKEPAGKETETPAENKENSDKTETEGANEAITEITEDTKLKDLLRQHPFLKKRLAEITPSFRMLQTPLGKLVASRATIKMMSEKSGLAIERIINGITDIIKDEAQKLKANK